MLDLGLPACAVEMHRGGSADPADRAVDGLMAQWRQRTARLGQRSRSRQALAAARAADALEPQLRDLAADGLAARRNALAGVLRRRRSTPADLIAGLALVREVCRREIGLLPYVEQLAAGYALLSDAAVEMDTGEGKTLTTLMPAALRALGGRSVHVVTANDYLAGRDGAFLSPALRALGLATGIVVHGMAPEARRAAYAADVTFVSNKEVAFDYLRDRLIAPPGRSDSDLQRKLGRVLAGAPDRLPLIARKLDVAIVDEIDSVLVDDAGTPLIISSDGGGLDPAIARDALAFAAGLEEGGDFVRNADALTVSLTSAGRHRTDVFAASRAGPWRQRVAREELVRDAATALHVLQRDIHYLVDAGKVVMIDSHSGRRMPDRYWGHNLQGIIEAKEGVAGTGQRRSLANISYQRFFRGYRNLAGMSGTVGEVAGELARVYGLRFVKVPRRRPNQRTSERRSTSANRDRLWSEAAVAAAELRDAGRPVLIGVRSVKEAERASAELAARGISHTVLSAAQDADEAAIVGKAGEAGKVTIATNMAGRGTDIKLGSGVAEKGGLALLLCERHDSRRADRQLIGRCARQGDPGGVIEFLSAEDAVLAHSGWLAALCRRLGGLADSAWPVAFRLAQWRSERRAAKGRLELVRRDEQMQKVLAIVGGLD